jgi:hypothetical protein
MEFTKEQLELKAFIDAEIETFVADAKAKGCSMYAHHTSEIEHWAGQGVMNIKQYKYYCVCSDHHEIYEEIYGHSTGWLGESGLPIEEIQSMVDSMVKILDDEAEEKKVLTEKEKSQALKNFNNNQYTPNLAFGNLQSLLSP